MRSKAACRTAYAVRLAWSGAVKRVNCHDLLPMCLSPHVRQNDAPVQPHRLDTIV